MGRLMLHKWCSGRASQVKVTEWLNIYCKSFGATSPCFYGWWQQRRCTWSRSTQVGLFLATQYTPKVVKLRHILRYCVSCAGQLQTAQCVAQHYVMRYTKSCKLRNIRHNSILRNIFFCLTAAGWPGKNCYQSHDHVRDMLSNTP